MKLTDLIKDLKPVKINGKSDIGINKIEYDSRKVTQNDVFVAVRGYKTDGHNYIEQAIKNGAAAVIAEEHTDNIKVCEIITDNTRKALSLVSAAYYGYPSKKMKLIGITGTNGKTTTTYLVKSILEFAGYKVGLIGTNQNMIGSKVIPTERTTPESLELQKLFADMVAEGAEYCVMEVSSHSLCLDRVYANQFYIGAFTNLTQDHLDFHKTMEEYARAKSILFTMCERAVVNADDKYVNAIIENADCKVVKYGINKKSDILAKNIKYNQRGVLFEVETPFGSENIRLDIPGEFSVYNALCAIGICQGTGVGISDIAKALILAKGVKGRAEVLSTPTDYTVMIDYAHTPDGYEKIFQYAKEITDASGGKIYAAFGCPGKRDVVKRPVMGRIAGEFCTEVVLTSQDPRDSEPEEIASQIAEGVKETSCRYSFIHDRDQGIAKAISLASSGDVVLSLGKGGETYMYYEEGRRPWMTDKEAARKALHALGYSR